MTGADLFGIIAASGEGVDILAYVALSDTEGHAEHELATLLMDTYDTGVYFTDNFEDWAGSLAQDPYTFCVFDAYLLPLDSASELIRSVARMVGEKDISLILLASSELLEEAEFSEGREYSYAFQRPYDQEAIKEAIEDFL